MDSLQGYKVLCYRQESITSPKPIYYKLNEWVYPERNCGALCVFDTLESAKAFILGCERKILSIHSCEYKRARKATGVSCLFPLTGNRRIVKKQDLPSGTVLASAVKILDVRV